MYTITNATLTVSPRLVILLLLITICLTGLLFKFSFTSSSSFGEQQSTKVAFPHQLAESILSKQSTASTTTTSTTNLQNSSQSSPPSTRDMDLPWNFQYSAEQLTPVDISVPRSEIPPLPRIPKRPFVVDLIVDGLTQRTNLSFTGLNLYPKIGINRDDPFFSPNSSSCNRWHGGQSFPPPPCTAENPCKNLMHTYNTIGVKTISTPHFFRQRCAGWMVKGGTVNGFPDVLGDLQSRREEQEEGNDNPLVSNESEFERAKRRRLRRRAKRRWEWYDDGPMRKITIPVKTFYPETQTRYFCSFVPQQQQKSDEKNEKFPLVIIVGGSSINASSTMYHGNLLWRMLGDDKNFAVISIDPVQRHWHPSGLIGNKEDGGKHDDVYKNFTDNDDVKFLDALIDKMVDLGEIDPSRIYLFGASNGLMFASFYGIIRSGSADGGGLLNAETESEREFLKKSYTGKTPKGNMIAAVAGFSGADPFQGFAWNKGCRTEPPPRSRLPFFILSRICDVISCVWIREWTKVLKYRIGSQKVDWFLLDMLGNRLNPQVCLSEDKVKESYKCDLSSKMLGHVLWPESYVYRIYRFFMKYKSGQSGYNNNNNNNNNQGNHEDLIMINHSSIKYNSKRKTPPDSKWEADSDGLKSVDDGNF